MANTGKSLYDSLPTSQPPLKAVTDALIELDEVLTGGVFDKDQIWGEAVSADDMEAYVNTIKTYMGSVATDANLKATWNKLLGSAGNNPTVSQVLSTFTEQVQKFIDGLADITGGEGGIQERINAFAALNNPNGGNYGVEGGPFGFIPALTGVINACGADVDGQGLTDAVKKVETILGAVNQGTAFITFANQSIALLNRALIAS